MRQRMNYSALCVLGGFLVCACGRKMESTATASATDADLELRLPKLVDLGAEKCIPCKKMAPILAELTLEYQGVFEVEFIDLWKPENAEMGELYAVRSIPTQIFFDAEGRELWRHEGYLSKEDLLKKWQELGFDFAPSPPQES
ncbi:thioredoxin family protein [Kiritimatiellaeota bacterium B1221]|nr:thioredoxin family protein [Kiritimatiellaeota bacterium B1221]